MVVLEFSLVKSWWFFSFWLKLNEESVIRVKGLPPIGIERVNMLSQGIVRKQINILNTIFLN